jgi:hypothetical protein
MNEAIRVFLIGLPDAGKTTFLAALYHVVESGEVQSSLRLERRHGDYTHLNAIRNQWADANSLERTKIPDEQSVSMILRDQITDRVAETVLPDLSGESFELQWTDRQMPSQYARLLREAAGGLLLVHPARVKEETLISEVQNLINTMKNASAVASGEADHSPPNGTGEPGQKDDCVPKEQPVWQAKDAPTALKLVELLQNIARVGVKQPVRLALIVSAWDRVDAEDSPQDWIAKRLPLVFQYLTANPELFCVRFYGVSAQGGELDKAHELRAVSRPSDRIQIVGEGVTEVHDISAPVQWVTQ